MASFLLECGLGHPGSRVAVPFLHRAANSTLKPEALECTAELAEYDLLIAAFAACGQTLMTAASQLEEAPPRLLEELGRAFPDEATLPTLASSFAACGARLQKSREHMAAALEMVGTARTQGTAAREAISARDAAWAPKLEGDKNAEILSKRFGAGLSIQEKRARLQAKANANEHYQSSDEKARSVLNEVLEQRWQVVAGILAELCHSYATIFEGSQQLFSDFSRLTQQLLEPGVAHEQIEQTSKMSTRSRSDGQAGMIADVSQDVAVADQGTLGVSSGVEAVCASTQETQLGGMELSAAARDACRSSAAAPSSSAPPQPAAPMPSMAPWAASTTSVSSPLPLPTPSARPIQDVQAPPGVPASSAAVAAVSSAQPSHPPAMSAPVVRRGGSDVADVEEGGASDAELSAPLPGGQAQTLDEPEAGTVAPAFSIAGILGSVFNTAANKTEVSSIAPAPPAPSSARHMTETNGMLATVLASEASVEESNDFSSMASSAPRQDVPRLHSDGMSDQCIVPSDTPGKCARFSAGDEVQVWSKGCGGWVDAVVDRVFEEAGVADGYEVPAGVVQVSFARGTKFIRREQAASQLRKHAASGGA
mmetsp:Transcript_35324/g.89004  ORF Transcript_35324/g.89004 Transcript_35324/m.89004 type:complete len:595 (-) Transcript_35324:244-2028(-)